MTKLEIGTRVTLSKHARDSAARLKIGQQGTIRELVGVHTVGVEWDGLTEGHDLLGKVEQGNAGWYVATKTLEVITLVPVKELQPMTKQVLEHLITVGTISGIEAIGMYKVRSLTKQISMLRDAGYQITSEWKRDATGQRYKRYYLSTEAVAA